MVLKSVGVLSVGKVMGCMYTLIGLLAGALFSLLALLGAMSNLGDGGGGARMFFGVFAIIVLPVVYGVMGFVCGIIGAAIYNMLAAMIGGIEMNFEQPPPVS